MRASWPFEPFVISSLAKLLDELPGAGLLSSGRRSVVKRLPPAHDYCSHQSKPGREFCVSLAVILVLHPHFVKLIRLGPGKYPYAAGRGSAIALRLGMR